MILNPKKCHVMSVGKDTHDKDVFYYENLTLKNSNDEEILGVTIDKKLTFHQHNKKMCRKAGQKLSALRDSVHTLTPIIGKPYTRSWSSLN